MVEKEKGESAVKTKIVTHKTLSFLVVAVTVAAAVASSETALYSLR